MVTAAPLRGDAGLPGEEVRLTLRQPAGGRLGTHGPAGSGGLRREGAGWGWASRGCRRPPPRDGPIRIRAGELGTEFPHQGRAGLSRQGRQDGAEASGLRFSAPPLEGWRARWG